MPSKRDRSEGVYDLVPQDPRDMAKAVLLEPQFPVMKRYVPRPQRLLRGRQDRVKRTQSPKPSAWRAVENDSTQGNERGAYVALIVW